MLCRSCHRKYDLINEKPNNSRHILHYSFSGKLLTEYETISDASNIIGISRTAIQNNLAGLSEYTNIGKFKYK